MIAYISRKHMVAVNSPTYNSWKHMIQRCSMRNSKNWKYYGGKGIRVCDEWHSYARFVEDMGERPIGMSIDRVNGDGHYEKSNCRWATHSEQMKNRKPFKRRTKKEMEEARNGNRSA